MFLCTVVLIALLVALARGGKWVNLTGHRFKKSWLIISAIMIQVLIFNPVWDRYVHWAAATNLLYVFSILLLLAFVAANVKISGLKILGLGVLSNALAIVANGGNMPSSLEGLKSILSPEALSRLQSGAANYNIELIGDQTRLKYLCDIFYLPHVNVYSIGDILIALGAFMTIQYILLGREFNKSRLIW